ncbi:MAG: hypothetical protein Q9170_001219 [Blastenia crenularia]
MAAEDEDECLIPLQDQRIFGAGIKRKKINFIQSSEIQDQQPTSKLSNPGAGDRYLDIVFGKDRLKERGKFRRTPSVVTVSDSEKPDLAICEICKLPIDADYDEAKEAKSKPHETSLAHQVCLEHSHPPSHLDRNRQGLKYLSSYGWDPDARQGLGATGGGIRMPIKAQPKNNTFGLGLLAPSSSHKVPKQPPRRLDAKQTRKGEAQAQRDCQKLRNMFYQNEDVEKYLGSNG